MLSQPQMLLIQPEHRSSSRQADLHLRSQVTFHQGSSPPIIPISTPLSYPQIYHLQYNRLWVHPSPPSPPSQEFSSSTHPHPFIRIHTPYPRLQRSPSSPPTLCTTTKIEHISMLFDIYYYYRKHYKLTSFYSS